MLRLGEASGAGGALRKAGLRARLLSGSVVAPKRHPDRFQHTQVRREYQQSIERFPANEDDLVVQLH